MMTSRLLVLFVFVFLVFNGFAQNIVVDGTVLSNSGGGVNNCVANGYKLNG